MDILHRVGVEDSSPEKVYEALTTIEGLAGRWTDDTTGSAEPGGVIEFRFPPGGFDMEVLEAEPPKQALAAVGASLGSLLETRSASSP